MTDKQKDEVNSCINSYYVLMEAGYRILMDARNQLNEVGCDLNSKTRKRLAKFMKHLESMREIHMAMSEDYDSLSLQNLDLLFSNADFLARLILLIGDRTCRDDRGLMCKNIEDYISHMTPQGLISDERLEHFRRK